MFKRAISTWFYFSHIMSLTHSSVSHSYYQLLMPRNLQSILTVGDCHHLPVTSHSISSLCQSDWLTSLGITRYQTVVLLLSRLHIITTPVNLFSCFQPFSVLIILLAEARKLSFSVMLTCEYHVELVVHLSHRARLFSSIRLFVNSPLRIDCYQF